MGGGYHHLWFLPELREQTQAGSWMLEPVGRSNSGFLIRG
jgi:hypothetical protein